MQVQFRSLQCLKHTLPLTNLRISVRNLFTSKSGYESSGEKIFRNAIILLPPTGWEVRAIKVLGWVINMSAILSVFTTVWNSYLGWGDVQTQLKISP